MSPHLSLKDRQIFSRNNFKKSFFILFLSKFAKLMTELIPFHLYINEIEKKNYQREIMSKFYLIIVRFLFKICHCPSNRGTGFPPVLLGAD